MSPPDVLSPLHASGLRHSYADRTVLDGIDLLAAPGSRLGVVGENGSGKSTLLRVLAGVEEPDDGRVSRPADLVLVSQEPAFPTAANIGDVLAEALAPQHAAVRRVEELAAGLDADPATAEAYDRALAWTLAHDAWDADRRAELAAHRLGLEAMGPDRPVAELSGGERTRLALAALVTRRPACVLLDEPTNHLDDAGLDLIEDFCVDLPGVVVAASHDRVFLDRVCTAVVDLDPVAGGLDGRGGRRYGGGFTAYLSAKRLARVHWEQTYAEQQHQLHSLRHSVAHTARQVAPHNRPPRDGDKFIHAFKGGNVQRTVSRRVRDAERRLDAAARAQVRRPPRSLRFDSALTDTRGGGAVSVRGLRVQGRVQVERLDVRAGGRLLVTGRNGSGKSSLLEVLAGLLPVDAGHVEVDGHRVGLLPQDVRFPRPESSALATWTAAVGPAPGVALRELGLVHPRDLSTPVGRLSVGQRRRLALAVLVARAPGVLLLDEPTNHLSLTLAGELEEALSTAAGTVVVASHDRWLRSRWDGPVHALTA
jgi:macrolide transport system ATP-binding/permease protein